MNRTDAFIREIRKRAEQLDRDGDPSAIERFGYPVDERTLGKVNANGLQKVGPQSATFVVSSDTQDRDGDVVAQDGLQFEKWAAAGAPFFLFHQQHPWPIGTSINPKTGELDVWPEEHRTRAKCWFDMDDPVGRTAAAKCQKGLMRSCSVAFVPIQASRIEETHKAQTEGRHRNGSPGSPSSPGWYFAAADVSEISIVGVGSNPQALLQDAPLAFSKALARTVCKGGGCFSRWCPRRTGRELTPAVAKEWSSFLHKFRQVFGAW